jgi:hypothetical protein
MDETKRRLIWAKNTHTHKKKEDACHIANRRQYVKHTRTYHDGQRRGVHAGVEEDAEDADDHGPALLRVRQGEHQRRHGADERHLGDEQQQDVAPRRAGGVEQEERDVGELDGRAGAVDGDDQHIVRGDEREAVHHPHQAVEQRRDVRDRGVLLHRTLLPDLNERRPACLHCTRVDRSVTGP